ncbi:MAG: ATP-binding protein [Hydrogenovibrio sp.]|uniref:hybrid sensor histidine kinase/response regulator n=1 Tax=Hydrogenovibrio sp. TaxID=2065821 RepID=UPI00287051CF|nr:ATP-binding protein [Hydrogenovibrio sp.]MDR9499826.1 ATP-binding protein [Hydrogenovibrio sp.]
MPHYLEKELYQLVTESSELFDFIQKAALDGLWYWDVERPEHEWMSPEFWRLLGYDPEEKRHLASEWQDLIHPEDLLAAQQNFDRHVADENCPYDQVVRYQHKNGSTVWVRCRGLAIRDQKGHAIRMLGAHNDITELKLAEIALVDANKVKSQFLARMSHELKTPLNAILGLTHLAQGDADPDKIQTRLSKIESSSQYLLNMVNDLLMFNKLEAGLVPVRNAEFHFETIKSNIQKTFSGQASDKDLAFEMDWEMDSTSFFWGDETLLTQVVSHLVSNAIKFTNHGKISVRLAKKGSKSDPLCQFEVLDTGVGLTLAQQQQLFQPFSQMDETSSRRFEGVGLGLVISQRIVNMLGGRDIEVESELGRGSCFRFALPLKEITCAKLESTLPCPPNKPGTLQTANVLVVDDNAINLALTAEILRENSCSVALAESNEQATAMIEDNKFDMVLTDFLLQKLEKFDSVNLWRNRPQAPVIVGMIAPSKQLAKNPETYTTVDDVIDMPLSHDRLSSLLRKWRIFE